MEQRYRPIVGPGLDKSLNFEYIANARTTAYNVSGGKSFRYPENLSDSLDLQMRCFVVQLFHKANDPVTLNLTVKSTNGAIIKFSLSTLARKQPQAKATAKPSTRSIKVRISPVPHDEWVNLCIDLEYVVMKNFPGGAFASLQNFEINPSCLIRHIFMVPTPLRPEASGQDLPNKVKFIGGIKSSTVLVAENAPKSTSKSRIPLRSQGAKVKPTISPLKPKRPKTVVGHEKTEEVQSQRYKSPSPTFEDDFDEQYDDEEEETDDENGAFMGSAPRINRADIDVKNGLPENEEEELELVFIEALNCYYCPNNQQYYQIDD